MPNTIIKASAGSGKTFQLSNEFLEIVFNADSSGRTHEKVGSILASTFSRKAAGEILDRILCRLAEAALNEDKQKDFAQHIPLPVKSTADRTKLLQKTVAEMAKNLYRLRICTLDSFFNKIASSFALELALPPGWEIMDDTEYQRSIHEAVQEVFDESKKNEARKLLHLLQKGEQSQNVTQEIIRLAKDFLPLVRSTEATHWDQTDADKLGTLTHGKMTEETLQKHLAPFIENPELRESILPRNKPKRKSELGEVDAVYKKAFNTFFDRVLAQNWEDILYDGIVKGIVSGENKFSKKQIEPPLINFLDPLVRHAKALWAETIIHQTIATRSLLDLVWEKLEAILIQKRGFRFEDITFCLGELFSKKPDALPQQLLSHRIDARTEHLLLDEFQDTSIPQWNILKPFVQSVHKGQQNSFFCVGDLKQAIYGWRGGVAEIFETVSGFLETEGADPPETPLMNETRRNSQPVIDAVNQVFLNINTNAAVCEKSLVAAEKWHEWFGNKEHETKSSTAQQGYCVVEAVPVDDAAESSDEDAGQIDTEKPFWKYTLNRVAELHRKHPNRSIGVLFRAGKNIATLLKGLKVRGIEASDEGGIPLTDSAAVQQILSAMTLIDHPGDTIVRYHLANGPLANLLPLSNYADNAEAEKAAHRWRVKLLSEGYGNTVKELMSALTPCEPKEMQRLEKLLELAYRFDDQAVGTRTRQFIESVNAGRMASPSAASVRVMTIHGAKGLEFDIVVLPDLDGKLVGMPPKMIVSRNSPTAPVNFVLRWVDQHLRTLLPKPYQDAFVQWQDNQVKESLAVLYVAMTRARYELVMLVPEKSRNGIGTYSGVLQAGLRQTDNTVGILYQTRPGGENWDVEPAVEKPALPSVAWHALATSTVLRNLPRDTPSSREFFAPTRKNENVHESRERNEVERPDTRSDATLRGTAIHACFASLRWIDLETTDGRRQTAADLQKIVEQSIAGKRRNFDSADVVNDFLAMCEQSEVRKVLMRSSYPTTEVVDVEAERRFAVRHENKLLHGSMDRLVIRRLGNAVVGLEIIDFKTDQLVEGETLEERAKGYAPQMEAYCQAARKLYPDVRNISTKLVFASLNRLVENVFAANS